MQSLDKGAPLATADGDVAIKVEVILAKERIEILVRTQTHTEHQRQSLVLPERPFQVSLGNKALERDGDGLVVWYCVTCCHIGCWAYCIKCW